MNDPRRASGNASRTNGAGRGDAGAERGATLVEFALVLPILLVLVLGIINFGYLFGQKLALNQAVREGARAAVVINTGEGADPLSLVQNAAAGSLIDNSGEIQLAGRDGGYVADCTDSGIGQNLQVKVTYGTGLLVPMVIPFQEEFTLRGEAVFRCEW